MKKQVGILGAGCLAGVALIALAAATAQLFGQNRTNFEHFIGQGQLKVSGRHGIAN